MNGPGLKTLTKTTTTLNIFLWARFLDPDRSLNCKRERFKIFEVESGSNRDDVIINFIIN